MYAILTNTATYSTKPVPPDPQVMTKERDNLPGQPRRHLKLGIGKKKYTRDLYKEANYENFAGVYHNYNLFTNIIMYIYIYVFFLSRYMYPFFFNIHNYIILYIFLYTI